MTKTMNTNITYYKYYIVQITIDFSFNKLLNAKKTVLK
jgi:hypothetical protein